MCEPAMWCYGLGVGMAWATLPSLRPRFAMPMLHGPCMEAHGLVLHGGAAWSDGQQRLLSIDTIHWR